MWFKVCSVHVSNAANLGRDQKVESKDSESECFVPMNDRVVAINLGAVCDQPFELRRVTKLTRYCCSVQNKFKPSSLGRVFSGTRRVFSVLFQNVFLS